MFIYSESIIRFVSEIKSIIRHVLANEIGLKLIRDRFYNRQQTSSYPIKIVIYNNRSMLGYFDPTFYEIGIHESLMHSSKEQLHDLIRHELAHYMTFITYGPLIQPHGAEFKFFCQQMGWRDEVYKASTCLDERLNGSELEESGILRKVQKLMALAASSNSNEAEQAMIKSQQLLLKHNIDSTYLGSKDEEKMCLKRILKQKRRTAKMNSIANILQTFFVTTVYGRTDEYTYLEIMGSSVNVEIAEYVANVLEYELENLWYQAQRLAKLKGTIAKNSFFYGLAKGYCNKIQALKREYNSDVSRALMVIEKKLVDAQAMIYPHLTRIRSNRSYCDKSSSLGELMGKQLNINPAINKSSGESKALLAYSE